MHHAQDRLIDVPRTETNGPARRHPQLADPAADQADPPDRRLRPAVFAFNYLGPTGNQRDEVTVIRRRSQEVRVLRCGSMAQMAMVMNLDKCIGCHTCSVTCKQAWTNRTGIEYVWFNNVETRPGQGYPRRYEDQETWKGGWDAQPARPAHAQGRRPAASKLLTIFSNPKLPSIQDYYEPWTYDYETLTNAPAAGAHPGRPAEVADLRQGHEDHLVGELGRRPRRLARPRRQGPCCSRGSPTRSSSSSSRRSCSTCRASASTASTRPAPRPARRGAIYKRAEDGIVLVDQDRCRGWRMCVSGCPYKKVYFNHRTGKAEKCTFCFPRVEVGIPTVCSETCVGPAALHRADALRRRPGSRGGVDRRTSTTCTRPSAGVPRPERPGRDRRGRAGRHPPRLDRGGPALPGVRADQHLPGGPAAASGVPDDADGLVHPAAVAGRRRRPRHRLRRRGPGNLFAAIDALRIPIEYLAELFTAGDPAPVDAVLRKLAAMRSYMRDINLGRDPDESIPAAVGHDRRADLRHVPAARHRQVRRALRDPAGPRRAGPRAWRNWPPSAALDYDGGPGMGGSGPFGEASGAPTPIAVENFQMLQRPADRATRSSTRPTRRRRVNLLNWDGKGRPEGLFPPPAAERTR